MLDEKIIGDFEDMISKAGEIKEKLNQMYYAPDVGTLRTRPIISMLIAAAGYLADNILVLEDQYKEKARAD